MLYPTELRARGATSITFKHLQPTEHLAFRSISVHSVQHPPLGRKFETQTRFFSDFFAELHMWLANCYFACQKEGR
jgi:hypothetical protein